MKQPLQQGLRTATARKPRPAKRKARTRRAAANPPANAPDPAKTLPELLTQAEFGKRIGVTQQSVSGAIAAGRIGLVDGRIPWPAAKEQWADNTDQSKPRNSVTGQPKRKRGRATLSFQESRAKREGIRVEREKLELKVMRGEYMRRPDVQRIAFETARKTRDQLVALPDKLDATLAAETDTAEVHRILLEAIEDACAELTGADVGNGR